MFYHQYNVFFISCGIDTDKFGHALTDAVIYIMTAVYTAGLFFSITACALNHHSKFVLITMIAYIINTAIIIGFLVLIINVATRLFKLGGSVFHLLENVSRTP